LPSETIPYIALYAHVVYHNVLLFSIFFLKLVIILLFLIPNDTKRENTEGVFEIKILEVIQ